MVRLKYFKTSEWQRSESIIKFYVSTFCIYQHSAVEGVKLSTAKIIDRIKFLFVIWYLDLTFKFEFIY